MNLIPRFFSLFLRVTILFGCSAFLCPTFSFGQMIDNRMGNAFKQEMYFNQEFIWMNKIKSVTGIVSVKRPNRPIEEKPDMVVYRFNEVGLLDKIDKLTSVAGLVDSLTIEYKRNDLGEVELKNENSSKGYFTTKFNYDGQGRVVRLDYRKTENISTQKGKLEPGQSTILNSETFSWHDAGKGITTKTSFNNYGLQYATWTITRDTLGYVKKETEELVMSSRTTTREYSYDERGWIGSIEIKNNMSQTPKKERFIYDKVGNLLKLEYWEEGKMTREIEVLYTPAMLIEAFLDHDIQSHDITITKIRYEYYNK